MTGISMEFIPKSPSSNIVVFTLFTENDQALSSKLKGGLVLLSDSSDESELQNGSLEILCFRRVLFFFDEFFLAELDFPDFRINVVEDRGLLLRKSGCESVS